MTITNTINLNAYITNIASELNWDINNHKQIYSRILEEKDIEKRLDTLKVKVFPWFMRNGEIDMNWRLLIKKAVKELNSFNYNLSELRDYDKLEKVLNILKPVGTIKKTKSGKENYMVSSKLLNFFFPNLIPKIDLYWIKDVCLRKVNNSRLFPEQFRISGPTDLQQYSMYLRFGALQNYDNSVLSEVEHAIGVQDAYAVAFEYCLLGFSKQEILEKKKKGDKKSKSC
jgi:hypothetical protein